MAASGSNRFLLGISLWITVALSALAVLFYKQPWVGSASLNDPRAMPRSVAPRGELLPEERATIALFR